MVYRFLDPKPRTFAVVYTPNFADPDGEFPLIEYNAATARKMPEGVVQNSRFWGGWRATLIVWLIRKLLPMPEYLYRSGQEDARK
jgi:hypothetical protein